MFKRKESSFNPGYAETTGAASAVMAQEQDFGESVSVAIVV